MPYLTGLLVKEEFTATIGNNFSSACGLEVVEAIIKAVLSKQAVPGKPTVTTFPVFTFI